MKKLSKSKASHQAIFLRLAPILPNTAVNSSAQLPPSSPVKRFMTSKVWRDSDVASSRLPGETSIFWKVGVNHPGFCPPGVYLQKKMIPYDSLHSYFGDGANVVKLWVRRSTLKIWIRVAQEAQRTGQIVGWNDGIWMFFPQSSALMFQGLPLQCDRLIIASHLSKWTGQNRRYAESTGAESFRFPGIGLQGSLSPTCCFLMTTHFMQGTNQILSGPFTST